MVSFSFLPRCQPLLRAGQAVAVVAMRTDPKPIGSLFSHPAPVCRYLGLHAGGILPTQVSKGAPINFIEA
jgi:hypothetical protein